MTENITLVPLYAWLDLKKIHFLDLTFWIWLFGFDFTDFRDLTFWIWLFGFDFLDLTFRIWLLGFHFLDLDVVLDLWLKPMAYNIKFEVNKKKEVDPI